MDNNVEFQFSIRCPVSNSKQMSRINEAPQGLRWQPSCVLTAAPARQAQRRSPLQASTRGRRLVSPGFRLPISVHRLHRIDPERPPSGTWQLLPSRVCVRLEARRVGCDGRSVCAGARSASMQPAVPHRRPGVRAADSAPIVCAAPPDRAKAEAEAARSKVGALGDARTNPARIRGAQHDSEPAQIPA